MRWSWWWQILIVVATRAAAQTVVPTICAEEACRCDSFTRVICNCSRAYDEITLRPDGAYRVPPTATGIIIDGCARVFFLPDTVRNLIQLRNVNVINVNHVVINERALAWSPFPRDSEMNPGLRILIENSTINEISSHAIQGRVDEITIRNCRVNRLMPFAFSSLTGVNSIVLSDNTFDKIEIQTFKKFTTSNFLLKGGSISTLPSRFLSGVEVTNVFRMEGVTVNYVFSSTFLVSSPKRVLIDDNIIGTLEGDSFRMVTRGPVTFRNNTVGTLMEGAFLGFSVDRDVRTRMGRQELLVDNNTITNISPSSLMFNETSMNLRIDGLNLNTTCACDLAEEWRGVYKLFPLQAGTINCWYPLEAYHMSLPTFTNSRCGAIKQNFWIYIVLGIVLIIIVATVVIFILVRKEQEKKKKLQIVMPDGKTYRETEVFIVVERAELLTTDL